MNDLRIRSVSFRKDILEVEFSEGQAIALPLAMFPKLRNASPSTLKQWRLIGQGLGVHWEPLQEDISLENLLLAHSRSIRMACEQDLPV